MSFVGNAAERCGLAWQLALPQASTPLPKPVFQPLVGQEAHRETELVALDIGPLEGLKGLLSVGFPVGGLYQWLENLNREFPGVSLQPLLGTR